MTKRIITALLSATMLLTAVFCFSAQGALDDDPAADVLIECDVVAATPNSIITVEVYLVNITRPYGILSCDIPLYYDSDVLEFITVEGIFPKYWDGYGEYVGSSEHSSNPIDGYMCLRSIPEAPDLVPGETSKYNVKGDKDMGFRITFRAIAEGETTIEVKSSGNNNILVVDSQTITNYLANPDSFDITISSDKALVDLLNGNGEESSDDNSIESSDISDSSSDVSEESSELSDVTSDDDSSSEDSGNSSESIDSSVDSASDDSSISVGDASSDSAAEDSDSIENADSDDSSATDDNGDDKDDSSLWLIVFIVIGALALAGGTVAVVMTAKAKKK